MWMPPGATVRRCATNCDGRTVKVITGAEDVDYSTETGGVCAIADTTANGRRLEERRRLNMQIDITLTEHDDCFVIVTGAPPEWWSSGTWSGSGFGEFDGGVDSDDNIRLLGLGGDDVLCGSAARDFRFYGLHMQRLTPLDVITRGPCHALHRFPKPHALTGGDGDDLLAAGPADDRFFFGGDGADKMFGGLGGELGDYSYSEYGRDFPVLTLYGDRFTFRATAPHSTPNHPHRAPCASFNRSNPRMLHAPLDETTALLGRLDGGR